MNSLSNIATNCVGYLDIHKGSSLAFGGCASFIGATVCGIAATPMAVDCVKQYKHLNKKDAKELAKLLGELAILYSGAAACTAGGIILIKSSCKTYQNQIAAATASAAAAMQAYQMTKKELEDYKKAVQEEFGAKKEQKVHDKVVTEEAKNENPGMDQPVPEDGKIWVKFYQTGVWCRCTLDDIYKAEKHLSDRFGTFGGYMWQSFNDLYRELDIPVTPTGDYYGWDAEGGIEFSYSWDQFTKTGDKFLVVDFDYKVDPNVIGVTGGYSEMAYE